jgi:uncharacterized membrane protein
MVEIRLNSKTQRLISLDALRGLVIVLMAVDHANYFVARMHPNGEFWGIPLPQYNSVLAFLTRFVTQPCAPGFFFLMGIGMVLFAESRRKQEWSESRISRHFIIRGLLLVLLQFFAENSAWLLGPSTEFHPPGGGGQVWFHFGVLYALGMTMILGAFLIRLKPALIFGISTVTVLLTQWLIPAPSQAERLFSPIIRMVLIPGQTGPMQVFYSFFPWLGCMGFGLFFAPKGTGFPLMYIFWLCGLVLLYPLCLWYGKFKSRTAQESLWRFF